MWYSLSALLLHAEKLNITIDTQVVFHGMMLSLDQFNSLYTLVGFNKLHELLWVSSSCLPSSHRVQTLGTGVNPPCAPNSATLQKGCSRYIGKMIQDASWVIQWQTVQLELKYWILTAKSSINIFFLLSRHFPFRSFAGKKIRKNTC